MKIFVVDNGGQWTHREWRVLKYLDVETKIVPNTTPFEELKDCDGLVLSGGAARVALTGELGNLNEYFKKADFPLLGICAGMQAMVKFYGGNVRPAPKPEFGKAELIIEKQDALFDSIPEKSTVWESHNDEVSKITDEFERLAYSDNCEFQAIKHKEKPFYGLQFHPEVEHSEYGTKMFENFIKICETSKR